MSSSNLPNYLKMFRKRSGLTQREVAYLLGCDNGSKISRYERQTRVPNLKTLLGFQTIFAADVKQLYSGTHQDIAEETRKRARTLLQELAGQPLTPQNLGKIEFLKRVAPFEFRSDSQEKPRKDKPAK